MAIYAIADTHLSLSTEKPMHIFGSRWHNWDKLIIKNWLETITDNDTVIIAGDISWAIDLDEALQDLKLIDALPGKKIISHGNHDYWWATIAKMNVFFQKHNISTINFLHNNAYQIENMIICGTRGWYNDEKSAPKETDYDKIIKREVCRLELSIKEGLKYPENFEKVVFFHFPPVFKNYICREIIDVLKKYNIKKCYYGHIHSYYDMPNISTFEGISFQIISADYLNFRPICIKYLTNY